jgi:hypothetical protein
MKPVVSLLSRTHIPDDILYQNLQGELVLLNVHTGIYFGLDTVGARMWQLIHAHQHAPLQDVLDALVGEYNVSPDQCAGDLLNLVARMEENRLLEIAR